VEAVGARSTTAARSLPLRKNRKRRRATKAPITQKANNEMKNIITALAIAVLFLTLSAPVSGEAPPSVEPTREQLATQIEILKDELKRNEQQLTCPQDEVVRQKCNEALAKRYELQKRLMEVTARGYEAQSVASAVILILVVIVVVSGVAFSGLQLWAAIKIGGVQATQDLEISAQRIRITSSVVGVVILIISLAFLYVYTAHFYAIKVAH
jgi:hypothetical protein